MTAGAAQTFIKGSGSFPYKRVVVAGTGPLLLASASQLIKARVDVAAVIESASIAGTRPRQALSLVNGGRILIDGARYISTLARSGTKIMTASAVTEIFGDQRVRGVRIRRVKRDWSLDPTTQPLDLECDAVLLSQGFNSSVAFASQGGAELSWNAQAAAWEPSRDELYRTTLPRVWSVGDCAGVGGSVVAEMEGKVAGEAIVEELTGRTVATPRSQRRTARRLQRLNNFRFAMEELFPSGSVATAAADEGTCVCRCQEVSAGDVRMAVRSGARSVRSVKLWTRAGMGTCQGRTCNFLIERIVGAELNMPLEQVTNKPSFQFPLRPVDSRVLNQLEQRVGDE